VGISSEGRVCAIVNILGWKLRRPWAEEGTGATEDEMVGWHH